MDQPLRRAEGGPTGHGQDERLATAIVLQPAALEQARTLEPDEQLRDRRGRDGSPPREIGAGDVAFVHCSEREVLHDGERRLVRREQTLDPAAHEWRGARERFRDPLIAPVPTSARH